MLAENTRKTYRTGWNSWARWANANNQPHSAPTAENIQRWLAELYREGKKPSTLRTYLAAVAHKLRGRPSANPARDHQVGRLLAGITRHAAAQDIFSKQAEPLR